MATSPSRSPTSDHEGTGRARSTSPATSQGHHQSEREAHIPKPPPAAAPSGGAGHQIQPPPVPVMDIHVGNWRGRWPKNLTSIISVEDNVLVRYDNERRILDMVEFDLKDRTVTEVAELQLGALELPPLHSIHHFTVKNEPYLFCLCSDQKRFVTFRTSGKRFSIPTSGSLPTMATHCLIFRYRHLDYLLAYKANSGEYTVMTLAAMIHAVSKDPHSSGTAGGSAPPAVVSQGRFKAGWTDIIWKGTTHVRCTKQKFFCYNSVSGEVAFENVWVRGGSTSSSVCSQEHVTVPLPPLSPSGAGADDERRNELKSTIQKPGCLAVPLHIVGRTVCLMYSHSALSRDTNKIQAGSSRLPTSLTVPAGSAPVGREGNAAAVAASSALLLQKRVFAHTEPWTHFCVLYDRPGGTGADVLCYSSVSGQVWISQLYQVKEGVVPEREVTLRSDLPGDGGVEQGGGRPGSGGAPGSEAAGETIATRSVRFGAPPSGTPKSHYHELTSQALRQVALSPLDIEQFAGASADNYAFPVESDDQLGGSERRPGGGRRRSKARKGGSTKSGAGSKSDSGKGNSKGTSAGEDEGETAEGRKDQNGEDKPSQAFSHRLSPRPASSSTTVRQRIADVHLSDNYHADIQAIVKQLQETDFAENSPCLHYEGMEELIAELEPLDPSKPLVPVIRASSARSASSRIAHLRALLGNQPPPWRSCMAEHTYVPSMEYLKFCEKLEKHRKAEVPQLKFSPQSQERLTTVHQSREEFSAKKIAAMHAEWAKKSVGANHPPINPEQLQALAERLGVTDVDSRHKKQEAIDKKYLFNPAEKNKKLDEEEFQVHVRRLAVDSVQVLRDKKQKALEVAHRPKIPPHPPLSKPQQAELGERLVSRSLQHREEVRSKILAIMDEGHRPVSPKRSEDEISFTSKRMWEGKTEAQALKQ